MIRRYEDVDDARLDEITGLARDELVPRPAEAPGFEAYYLLRAGKGVIVSFGAFDAEADAERSNKIAREVIQETGLSDALPKAPEIITGEIISQTVLQTSVR